MVHMVPNGIRGTDRSPAVLQRVGCVSAPLAGGRVPNEMGLIIVRG